MRKKSLWVGIAVVFVILAAPRPGYSIFGIEDVIYLVKLVITANQQLDQMRSEVNLMQQQVKQMTGMVTNYQAAFAQLQGLSVNGNSYNIGDLVSAANGSSGGSSSGYASATIPINASLQTAIRRLKTRYGDVVMADASNVAAWNLIGSVRSNANQNSNDLNNLVKDAMTAGDGTSTLMVQQKSNAAMALAVQQLNTMQQVEAAQLEQAVERAQRERNEAAANMSAAAAVQNIPTATTQAMAGVPASGVPTLSF
jgi:hypothetical protein